MANAVEPPAVDEQWDDSVEPADGDWDRDFWLAYARDVHGLDEELLADRPTEWIVGRVAEEDPQYYRGGA